MLYSEKRGGAAVEKTLFNGYNKQYTQYYSGSKMQTPAASIRRLAELFLEKGNQVKLHPQNYDEFLCVISGRATVYCNDVPVSVSAGQIFFIRQDQNHRIVADNKENFRYYCVGVTFCEDEPVVKEFLEKLQGKDYFVLEDRGAMQPLFARMTGEIYVQDERTCNMLYFSLCQILILLCRSFDEQSSGKQGYISSSDVVYRVLRFVDSEYMHLSRVKEIADSLSYSEHYLSHVFKEKMDITIKEYLTQRKIAKAMKLLQSENLSITEVSNQLQFSSLHSFGLAFKRCAGMSPSQYRKEVLGQKET